MKRITRALGAVTAAGAMAGFAWVGTCATSGPVPSAAAPCSHGWPTDSNFKVAGLQTHVPEFNDCQRFTKWNGTREVFDSVEAVYVVDSIDAVTANVKPVPFDQYQGNPQLAAEIG